MAEDDRPHSINEPPGSNVAPPVPEVPPEPEPLEVTSISPDTMAIGEQEFTLRVRGMGFTDTCVIWFDAVSESTSLDPDSGELTALIDPQSWTAPQTVPVEVRDGERTSNVTEFTFVSAATTRHHSSRRK